MNEINGPTPSRGAQIGGVRSQSARTSTRPEAGAELSRAQDDVNISGSARALSELSRLPDVRSELVNRISQEVMDPEYVDQNFEGALDRMFNEVF